MKRIVLFIFICTSLLATAQKKYKYDFTNYTLLEAVQVLSRKHKFKFSYDPRELEKHVVDRKVTGDSEIDLISNLFEDLPFDVRLSDGIYLLIPRKAPPKPKRLHGQINDRNTGKPLAFAHVQVDNAGTVSNEKGQFLLSPRVDTLTLHVSHVGYRPLELKVPPNQDIITLYLQQNSLILPEAVFNVEEFKNVDSKPGSFDLALNQLDALPTLGESDLFKSVQLLPGISATDESSSGLTIRGNVASQNLVLMDGFTLYRLDHFFGVFSIFNPYVISNVNVYKGGFGAEYGGRTSSVVDVTGKVGSKDKFTGGMGVNLLSTHGFIETPISGKTSFIIGGRKSFNNISSFPFYNDFITSNRDHFHRFTENGIAEFGLLPSFHFYDVNSKIQHRFSSHSQLDVNLFLSKDSHEGESNEKNDTIMIGTLNRTQQWSNFGLSAIWKKILSSKWMTDVVISTSQYASDEELTVSQTIFGSSSANTVPGDPIESSIRSNAKNSIGDFTIKSNHEIAVDSKNLLKFGGEYNTISVSNSSEQSFASDVATSATIASDYPIVNANTFSWYGSHQFQNELFTSNFGLRTSFYGLTKKWYMEPRFDVRVKIFDYLHLKGGASYHRQYINQVNLLFNNKSELFWVLADEDFIPIQRASHITAGIDYASNEWTFDVEYYQKHTSGIIENQFLILPSLLHEDEVDGVNFSGVNVARGVDLIVKYEDDPYNSWISYSYGVSRNKFWYQNQGKPYPSNFDQRHEVNFVNVFKTKRWKFSSVFIYGSGKPFTPPARDPSSHSLYEPDRINQERLPAYSRVDLSAAYSFPVGNANFELGTALFNVLNRRNIKSRTYTRQFMLEETLFGEDIQENQFKTVMVDTYLLGFAPNFFLNVRF